MPDLLDAQNDAGIRRTRKRIESLKFDPQEVAARIKKFHQDDTNDRTPALEMRIQRYAKLRMWTSGKDWPWADASDVGVDDMMTNSLRIQDTLHNAVMSMRPVINSKSLDGKDHADKQKVIDDLIDYQVFVEQEGERFIGDCADAFVNDGVFTIFIPWVREDREIVDLRYFPKIPDEVLPIDYFKQLIVDEFPDAEIRSISDGWDWEFKENDKKGRASFYTKDDERVELVIRRTVRIFDGPRPRVCDWEDVLYPHRAGNLQIPGPANPKGASHVILVDYPTVDEIKRLKENGFYDLLTDEQMDHIERSSLDQSVNQAPKNQKDRMQGSTELNDEDIVSHKPLTRLLCFDMYDIDEDGLDEDVVWWMILETQTVVKAKMLTEMWPANPPRRPFAGSQFIPVRDRYTGISLLELMEPSHDTMKMLLDQTIDSGTLANAPFFFYRATSNMKPEVIRAWPGEGYPLGNPKEDVYFPQFSQTAQAFGINMMTLLDQRQQKLTMNSDLNFGKIPAGQASALRTTGAQQGLLAQGEARPERILRRFFMGLTEAWAQIHELNQRFLPEKKKYMVVGVTKPEEDPYQEVTDAKQIDGRFRFEFRANVMNTSKAMLQQALERMLQMYMNPLMVQLGLVTPDNMYRMLRDFGKSLGTDPQEKSYLTAPTPTSNQPLVFVEEVLYAILHGETPEGVPAEGSQAHLQKLIEFMNSDKFGFLTSQAQLGLFQGWLMKVRDMAIQEAQQQQLAQQMQAYNQQISGGQRPGAPALSNPPVQENELIDESLPSAR